MRTRLFLYSIVAIAFLSFIVNVSIAQVLPNDAAGVRIFRNPEGMSAADWYAIECGKTFKCGKPASIIVDGYDGIRDGNSLYVNVANKTSTGAVYTNIYFISFAKGASAQGSQIFDQLLKNWKFNTNITDPLARGALRRDTRRRAALVSMRRILDAHKAKAGSYPALTSGSYIRGASFSVWPSWQETLGKELGFSLPQDPGRPFIVPDPKNPGKEKVEWKNFVGCATPFDPVTCWDAKTTTMRCPQSAYVYAYRLKDDGTMTITTTYESAVVPQQWTTDQDEHNITTWQNILCTPPAVSVDADTDGDGVKDGSDNCLAIANADQRNSDGDSAGDACDTCRYDDKDDDDKDGLCADRDSCPASKNLGVDNNGNGIDAVCDTEELCGNGRLNANLGEECDAGPQNGALCTAARDTSCQYCSKSCKKVTIIGERCGDGVRNGPEECDGQDVLPGVQCLQGTRSCSQCRVQCSAGVPVYPIQGAAWSANAGWIRMRTDTSGVGIDLSDRLVGSAWNANLGWIDMSGARVDPGTGVVSGTATGNTLVGTILMNPTRGGVVIQKATGKFSGFAWSSQIGWIDFGTAEGNILTVWKP